jgi:hypothetical protein
VRDAGWPITGELQMNFTKDDPALVSPAFFCRAEEADTLVFEAAIESLESRAQLFWATLEAHGFEQIRSMDFATTGDGKYREYRVRVADSAAWRGEIVQLRLDPVNRAMGSMRVRSIRLERAR